MLKNIHRAFTTGVLSKEPRARPNTNTAAPNDAAIGWYSTETVLGANINAMFPTYPLDIANRVVKLTYHHSDSNITCSQ